jgi:hypothetical protein
MESTKPKGENFASIKAGSKFQIAIGRDTSTKITPTLINGKICNAICILSDGKFIAGFLGDNEKVFTVA